MALPENPNQLTETERLIALFQQLAQQQTLGADQVRDLPLAQARNTVEAYNDLQRQWDLFQAEVGNEIAAPLQAANEEIDKRYKDQLKDAVDFETQQMIRTQMEAEKAARARQLQETATAALNAKRAKTGVKSSEDILSELQIIEPEVTAARSKLTALRTGDPNLPSTQGLSSIESADRALSQQRMSEDQFEAFALRNMMQAEEGGPEAKEEFIRKIENNLTPSQQSQTIQVLRNMGFQSPRPIQLKTGETIQPAGISTFTNRGTGATTNVGSAVGGGYAQMGDGTYQVYLPGGGRATAATEAEAKQLSQAAPELASDEQVREVFGERRAQRLAQLENNLAQEQARLAQFVGDDQSMQNVNAETPKSPGPAVEQAPYVRTPRSLEDIIPPVPRETASAKRDSFPWLTNMFRDPVERQRYQEGTEGAQSGDMYAVGKWIESVNRNIQMAPPEFREAAMERARTLLQTQLPQYATQPEFRNAFSVEDQVSETEESIESPENEKLDADPEAAKSNGTMRNFFGSMFGAGMPMTGRR